MNSMLAAAEDPLSASEERAAYVGAFVQAHELTRQKKFEAAAERWEKLNGRGPQADLFLAICKAGLSDYHATEAVLRRVFHGSDSALATALCDVIVQSRMGFKDDALHELVDLVNEHKEFPALCLWLGEMLEEKRQLDKARQCYGLAIRRDHGDGAVAHAASRQLRRLQSQLAAVVAPAGASPHQPASAKG